jgi:putative transposase
MIDWNIKKILSWKLSNIIDVHLTTSVLREALYRYLKPDIVNTAKRDSISLSGSQYTAYEHINILKK